MSLNLKIDPEFQNKIPPLTEAEFRQLEENILNDGEVYEPIVTWNGVIVDGHNRWKIILANPWLTYKIREMSFADKWEAFDWMYRKQLGRRNLTDEQKTFLLGKQYEARKHIVGNRTSPRDKDGKFQCIQNDNNGHNGRTVEEVAKENNVSPSYVSRAERFANGIESIQEEDPELADAILTAEKKVSKKDVEDIGRADPSVRKDMIESLKAGKESKKKRSASDQKELNSIVDGMTDGTVMEFTIDHLTDQIRLNADAFIRSLSNLIMDHADIANVHQPEIVKAIDESITKRIIQIKETLNNGTQL